MTTFIPDYVAIESEFFGKPFADEGLLIARVLAIFRDLEGDQWCAFQMPDMGGTYVIHLGSNFFKGWTHG